MRATIEPTTKIVEVKVGESIVPARVWEGKTERGLPITMLIVRVAAPPGATAADLVELEESLRAVKPPSAELEAWPTRLVWP